MRESSRCVERQEEEILHDNRRAGDERDGEGRGFLKTSPDKVDIKEEEKNTEANDRPLER